MSKRGITDINEAELRKRAASNEELNIRLTNNYAFQKVFKNEEIVKGFLMALLHLKENEIESLEVTDPFVEGEKGQPYYELPPCIHVGILDFNYLKSPGFYHRILLKDDKTGESYSSKFQFHVIELSKLDTTKGKARKQELYRWARLISASNWEEVREESEGNHYMERAMDEIIKMSRDERERYLYLREQMAISDKVSQLHSAEQRGIEQGMQQGIQRGELLKLIALVQKKKSKGESIEKIAEDLLEDEALIKTIYDTLVKYPEKDKSEICDFI